MGVSPELTPWLMEHGGPVIRYRTLRDLLRSPDEVAVEHAEAVLLKSDRVREQLANLASGSRGLPLGRYGTMAAIHGSAPSAFENTMGRLTDMGLRSGIRALDTAVAPYRDWLVGKPDPQPWGPLLRTIVAAFLARAGYGGVGIDEALNERLRLIHSTARRHDFDIHRPPPETPKLPRGFARRSVLRADLHEGGAIHLPWVHDIIGLAVWCRPGTQERRRLASVTRYILDERYQRLESGYGVLLASNRRYYAIGWDVKLPGFAALPPDERMAHQLLQRLRWLAGLPGARRHPYFDRALTHLREFRTGRGTYLLPASYRPKTGGYWVLGGSRLEQPSRRKRVAELESTFSVLELEVALTRR